MEWTLMFLGYIFLGSVLLFIFVGLPLWYIGKYNAEMRKKISDWKEVDKYIQELKQKYPF